MKLRLVSAVPAVLVAALLAGSSTVPAADAAPGVKPRARADTATVKAGTVARVNVLKNDRVSRKPRARVRILSAPSTLKVRVSNQRIVVRPRQAGTYSVRYRVLDTANRQSAARLRIVVPGPPAPPTPPVPPTPETPTTPVPTGPLAELLPLLSVSPEHVGGYDRALYKHWVDADGDGCDTREEVLLEESIADPEPGAGCQVSGAWTSYYDGVSTLNPSSLDIDHMVPLAEAHASGAYAWSAAKRQAYANDLGDPRSLVAVSASSNRSKSDRDPAEWMPPRAAMTLEVRCRYIREWVAVKIRWSLTVDVTEKESLTRYGQGC